MIRLHNPAPPAENHIDPCARGRSRRSFLRLGAVALATVLVAGCASKPPADPTAVPGLQVASRVIGNAAAYIEVDAVHRSFNDRIERITLVAPDGREIAAEQVRVDTVRNAGRRGGPRPFGSIGLGTGSYGGGFGIGLGIGFPLNLGSRKYARDIFRTRATFRVPNPKAYLADPTAWKVRVHLRHRKRGAFYRDYPAPVPAAG